MNYKILNDLYLKDILSSIENSRDYNIVHFKDYMIWFKGNAKNIPIYKDEMLYSTELLDYIIEDKFFIFKIDMLYMLKQLGFIEQYTENKIVIELVTDEELKLYHKILKGYKSQTETKDLIHKELKNRGLTI